MKTSAITIDEETIEHVDRLVGRGGRASRNRSQLIRQALHDSVSRLERLADDEREAAIVRRHRGRLARQASALRPRLRRSARPPH